LAPVIQRLMNLHAELMDGRRILRNVGGNLNDVARHANSTREVHQEIRRIEALVESVVQRLDETVSSIGELMALARERARSQP
jgi:methyl-accepting chemotaxis protein